MGIAPSAVQPQHTGEGSFLELGAPYLPVSFVLVFTGSFLAPSAIPYDASFVACKINGIVPQTVVRLELTSYGRRHLPKGHHGVLMQHQHTCHGIRTIHQRGGTFQYLDGMDSLGIYFNTMLVTPLLSFLTDAVIDCDNAVIAQSTDDGFGDSRACGDLINSRLTGDSVYDIGG